MPKQRYKHVQVERSRHGRTCYYFRRGNSPRIRLPDNYGTPQFVDALQIAATSGVAIPRAPVGRPSFARTQRRKVGLMIKRIIQGAKARANNRNLQFDIDETWALSQIESQQFKCPLTGIPFFMSSNARSARHPFAPSLDRIDCARGYTKDNVRVVIFAINIMLLDWGAATFERVINGYRHVKGTKSKLLFPAARSERPHQKKTPIKGTG